MRQPVVKFPARCSAKLGTLIESLMPRRPENLYPQYHAHIYFGPDTVTQAR